MKTAFCEHCRKPVRGKAILVVPPNYEVALGVSVERTYHPACFRLLFPAATVR